MKRWHPSIFVPLLLAPCACKSGDSAQDAGASSAVAASTAGDPAAKKHVTPKDCETWAEHGSSVFVSSVVGASAACPPEAREAIRKKFQDDIVSIRTGANSVCSSHLNEAYSVGDATCFMNATDAVAMQGCKFGPMISPGDTDVGSIINSMRTKCAITAPPGMAPPGSATGAQGTPM
jgi:hypothetical protein